MLNPTHSFAPFVTIDTYAKVVWVSIYAPHTWRSNPRASLMLQPKYSFKVELEAHNPKKSNKAVIGQSDNIFLNVEIDFLAMLFRFDSRSAQGKIPQSQKSPDTHPFLCAICNNRYLNKSTLAKHILKAHVNQQSYRKNRRPQRKPTTMKRVKKNPLIAILSQKTAESHPFLCDICGDRYKHVGRLAEHHRRDHAETRMSTPIRINQVGPMIHYVCECTYTTSEPGHYHRHRSVCKRKSNFLILFYEQ